MDCKNLMIGDWVEYNDSTIQYKTKIYGFTEYGDVMIKSLNSEESIEMLPSYIEPIQITEHFIANNNLRYKKIKNNNKYCDVILVKHSDKYMLNIYYLHKNRDLYDLHIPIKYVHELQHALRLFKLNEFADNLIV